MQTIENTKILYDPLIDPSIIPIQHKAPKLGLLFDRD